MGLFNRNKKPEQTEIVVANLNDCVIYKIDVDTETIAKDATINVSAGSQAYIYVDGKASGTYQPGKHALDLKKQKKEGSNIYVLAANRDNAFTMLFGIGNVPFNDRKVKRNVPVGIRGEVRCKIIDPQKLFEEYGTSTAKVTADNISDRMFGKFREVLVSEFASKLDEYDFNTLSTSVSELSQVIHDKLFPELNNNGIMLVSCSISEPYFPENYINERNQLLADKERELTIGNQKKTDEDVISDIFRNKPKREEAEKVIICPFCKAENEANARYCNICGRKIK